MTFVECERRNNGRHARRVEISDAPARE